MSDIEYSKERGHHCWWLKANGTALAHFDDEAALDRLIEEIGNLRQMTDRAHSALHELLASHINIGEPAAQIAKRGLWGDE